VAVAGRYTAAEGLAKTRLRIDTGDLEEVTDQVLSDVMFDQRRGRRGDRRLHHHPGNMTATLGAVFGNGQLSGTRRRGGA
jgi:hypothetical protein